MSHGDTRHRHNGDGVPLTYHPCSERYRSSVCNDFGRELIKKERVGKKGWSALICLGVAQLDSFGSVENLIWNRCCSACCTHLSSWKCLPAMEFIVLLHNEFSCRMMLHKQKKENISMWQPETISKYMAKKFLKWYGIFPYIDSNMEIYYHKRLCIPSNKANIACQKRTTPLACQTFN